jgi:hypothetical protein
VTTDPEIKVPVIVVPEIAFDPASVPYNELVATTVGVLTFVVAVNVLQLIALEPEIWPYTTEATTAFDPK